MSLSTSLISVDLVAFRLTDDSVQVLTHRDPKSPDFLRLPAGRIEPELDTCLKDTARRQLERLTSEPASYYEQVITIGDELRDSRGWSLTVVYYALFKPEQSQVLAPDAQWVDIVERQPAVPLAYDHSQLVTEALERLQNKIQYSSLPVHLLPEEFTLSDIQKVFTLVLEKAPPMRSIRNRFLKGELLEDTGKKRHGRNRPAALYRIHQAARPCLFNRSYLTTQT